MLHGTGSPVVTVETASHAFLEKMLSNHLELMGLQNRFLVNYLNSMYQALGLSRGEAFVKTLGKLMVDW